MTYCVIAERELVIGFSLIGIDGFVAHSRDGALEAFNRVTGQIHDESLKMVRPKILIITEQIADFLHEEVKLWQLKGDYPLIVEIPPLQGHLEGKKSLMQSISEAVGIKV